MRRFTHRRLAINQEGMSRDGNHFALLGRCSLSLPHHCMTYSNEVANAHHITIEVRRMTKDITVYGNFCSASPSLEEDSCVHTILSASICLALTSAPFGVSDIDKFTLNSKEFTSQQSLTGNICPYKDTQTRPHDVSKRIARLEKNTTPPNTKIIKGNEGEDMCKRGSRTTRYSYCNQTRSGQIQEAFPSRGNIVLSEESKIPQIPCVPLIKWVSSSYVFFPPFS